ncbi:MAG: hypothetical protein GX877_01130 [Bacteroidales bacterium]|nr:hypothetical protein [Bacteroidales bacterium]
MKTKGKPFYPVLELSGENNGAHTVKRKKGFFILFIMVVLATVCGMVFFLLFVTSELSVMGDRVLTDNGEVRDSLSMYKQNEGEETAPFLKSHEKNTYTTTSYK